MLYLITGTDREKARAELDACLKKQKGEVVRISDAHTLADLQAALQGGGMFGGRRTVVLDSVFANVEMGAVVLSSLQRLRDGEDAVYIIEEKLDAATKKQIEKYAEESKKFDAPKKVEEKTIFQLANALRRGDKKALWISYQRELHTSAPEAIHGVLFWGAKQYLLSSRSERDIVRAKRLVAQLAELPHEARRGGVELEYALERFALSIA